MHKLTVKSVIKTSLVLVISLKCVLSYCNEEMHLYQILCVTFRARFFAMIRKRIGDPTSFGASRNRQILVQTRFAGFLDAP